MRFQSLIHALIGLTSLCGAAPTGDTTSIEKPSNLAPARKLPDDVGLPSQLAWEAWLIIAKRPDAPSSFESATVPRRIAPKSIFVAPLRDTESQCSDGYKRNGTGHCVRDTIKIDPMNNRDFQRKRLIMFPPTLTVKYSPPVDSAASASDPVKVDLGGEDTGPMEISLVQVRPFQDSGSRKDGDVMAPYEVSSGSKADGQPETFVRINSTDLPVRGVVLPAEIVDEKNQPIVDYETPVNVEIVQSSGLKQAVDGVTESTVAGEAQPTVILLLSAAKDPPPPEGTEPPETPEVTTVQREEGTTLDDETTTLETSEAPSTTIHPEGDADTPTESTDEILLHGETSIPTSPTPPSPLPKTDEGNVSSESSITGDRIMETTLLDVNPATTSSRSDLDDFREIFEAEEFAPEVVSSLQDTHSSNAPVSRITKRTGDPDISTSSRNASSQLQERRRTSDQSRVRFPDEQRPKGFVSFPSDNRSNSVHGDLDPRAQPAQGQKRTYYRLPTGWRVSDPQHQQVARSSIQQLQNQMRLRFWARMPLIRDPSMAGGSSQTTVNNQRDRVLGQSVRGGQVHTG